MAVRPGYTELMKNYPVGSVADVLELIGGKVKANNFQNTCAIRISRALNYSGHTLPPLKGETVSGADGYQYIFRVTTMKRYLTSTFGKPDFSGQPNDAPQALVLTKGIIAVDVSGWSDATGHVTLWNGIGCADNCYFAKASAYKLWKMPG